MSSYQESLSAAAIVFDDDGLAKAFSNFAAAQGITTNAQWVTFVNALTMADPNMLTILKGFLRNAPRGLP